ncbi:MAG: PHP domain-containing protein [Treponemataceae bacterium]|nr:PHP domain-containing protein [Treponemataceae bacterium]
MAVYKYETHLHTAEVSACGVSPAADYIEAYSNAGYAGIIVTDHFFNGNCGVNPFLSWEEKIDAFCLGYENALNAAKGTNFKVFFGIEYNFGGDEYLLYGLTKKHLKEMPQIMEMNHAQLFEAINSVGGLMIQAHPFRRRSYIKEVRLHPKDVHGAEVYNAGNRMTENFEAIEYAKQNGLVMTSGSDIHNAANLFSPEQAAAMGVNKTGGVAFNAPLETIEDYIAAIKTGTNYTLLGI